MSGFQKFKRELPAKKVYRSLAGINPIHKECQHVINVSNKFENEKNERLSQLS